MHFEFSQLSFSVLPLKNVLVPKHFMTMETRWNWADFSILPLCYNLFMEWWSRTVFCIWFVELSILLKSFNLSDATIASLFLTRSLILSS